MAISGFTFGHNLIDSGYPIIEAIQAVREYVNEIVFVDMQSTDATRQVVEAMGCRIVDGEWGNEAGKTLAKAYALHTHCKNNTILHFEADEVYGEDLAYELYYQVQLGQKNLAVQRLQVEQNFQRCRWYPEPVHRVFQRDMVKKVGHTTDLHIGKNLLIVAGGYLWDCTNCFRDSWFSRIEKQAELWNEKPKYRHVPLHFNQPVEMHREQAHFQLSEPHWTFKTSPFALPDSLKDLVGLTKYSDSEGCKVLIG